MKQKQETLAGDKLSIAEVDKKKKKKHSIGELCNRFAKGDSYGWLASLKIKGDIIYQESFGTRLIALANRFLPEKIAVLNDNRAELALLGDKAYDGRVERALKDEHYIMIKTPDRIDGLSMESVDGIIGAAESRRNYAREKLSDLRGLWQIAADKRTEKSMEKLMRYQSRIIESLTKFINTQRSQRDRLILESLAQLPFILHAYSNGAPPEKVRWALCIKERSIQIINEADKFLLALKEISENGHEM